MNRKLSMLACAISMMTFAPHIRAATLAADYQLQNNYVSSIGTIGDLSVTGNASTDVSFISASVNGYTQFVSEIKGGSNGTTDRAGLQSQTAGFISSSDYSAVLLANFSFSTDVVATKVFDFKNLSSDNGVYVNDTTGLLAFNGVPTAIGGTPVVAGQYSRSF